MDDTNNLGKSTDTISEQETREERNIRRRGLEEIKRLGGGARSYFSEFVNFIRTQGVVGFATGFILGGAVSTLVKSFIENLVNPILGILLGRAHDLSSSFIPFFGTQIMYGQFLNDLIGFIVLAAVVYFGVKKIGLDKLDKPKK